jgi:NDP-sugar pyrophosphorylase family protein
MPGTERELPEALILCGGLGTRLRPVLADRPKGLAEVSGRAFLDILTGELMREGLRRFILCTGHGAAEIAAHFRSRRDAEFLVSTEDRPLGTGGAVAHALPQVGSDPFLVVNGDSICRVSYADLLESHRRHRAVLSVVVTPPSERIDVGTIRVDSALRILEFSEKPGTASLSGAYVNAGIYVVQREAMSLVGPAEVFSLERELIPAAVASGRCFAFPTSGPLIDIGTPERLRNAQMLLR